MKCEYEKYGPVLEELGKLKFTNSKPVYIGQFDKICFDAAFFFTVSLYI